MIGQHATTIAKDGDAVNVTYHHTIVGSFDGETATLNSGGYLTATTKRRINQALETWGIDAVVYQENHDWYVRLADGSTIPFFDGIEITRSINE